MFFLDAAGIRTLTVEGLTVVQAAAEKLGPFRDSDVRVGLFGEQAPQLRMMPA